MRVGIAGVRGYTGLELLRLLRFHPEVEVVWATSRREAGERLGRVLPQVEGSPCADLQILDPNALAGGDFPGADAAFLALPHGAAAEAAVPLRAAGIRVIDLSADLRLASEALHNEWYAPAGEGSAALRAEAVYGLPELFRDRVAGAGLVANPGCYPTACALAAAPLLKVRMVHPDLLVFDCKSGISGAGRSPSMKVHYSEVNENVRAYSLAGSHRHTPEIEQALTALAGGRVRVTFSPHLIPMTRGILATTYLRPLNDLARPVLLDLYREFYAGDPFVRVRKEGLPGTKDVLGSNFCDIGLEVDARSGWVVVVAAIDNLVKGASGQAVQNLNVMTGLDETTGLIGLPLYP